MADILRFLRAGSCDGDRGDVDDSRLGGRLMDCNKAGRSSGSKLALRIYLS